MRASLAVVAALFLPAPAFANCAPGGVPAYADIAYIRVSQYSLTGIRHPSFEFEGTARRVKRDPSASLKAARAVPFIGTYVAEDPQRVLEDVVSVLERSRFFSMHMTAPFCCYIDGPEDEITVVRCGVANTLATVSDGGEANLDDAQGKAFFRLEDELRDVIFAEKWTPTPARH